MTEVRLSYLSWQSFTVVVYLLRQSCHIQAGGFLAYSSLLVRLLSILIHVCIYAGDRGAPIRVLPSLQSDGCARVVAP